MTISIIKTQTFLSKCSFAPSLLQAEENKVSVLWNQQTLQGFAHTKKCRIINLFSFKNKGGWATHKSKLPLGGGKRPHEVILSKKGPKEEKRKDLLHSFLLSYSCPPFQWHKKGPRGVKNAPPLPTSASPQKNAQSGAYIDRRCRCCCFFQFRKFCAKILRGIGIHRDGRVNKGRGGGRFLLYAHSIWFPGYSTVVYAYIRQEIKGRIRNSTSFENSYRKKPLFCYVAWVIVVVGLRLEFAWWIPLSRLNRGGVGGYMDKWPDW